MKEKFLAGIGTGWMCLVTLIGKFSMSAFLVLEEKGNILYSLHWMCLIFYALFLARHDLAEKE